MGKKKRKLKHKIKHLHTPPVVAGPTARRIALPLGRVFSLLVIAFAFLLLPQQNYYALQAYTQAPQVLTNGPIIYPTPNPLPVNATRVAAPELSAEGIVITDVATGMVLYEKNPNARLLPASTTKIMTALIALREYDLEDVVTVKTVISEPQIMGLKAGEKITVENLLYGILVHSANDAAYALAEHYATGVEGFVAKMNENAQELHLSQTRYANPIGFDDENQYTTAADLSRLSVYALKNKIIQKIIGVPQITVSDTTFSYFHALKNVNELLGKVPGVSGFKTGFTQQAGECLVTTAQRNGDKVLIVVLRSADRFGETEQLINWVFTNFKWQPMSYPTPS